MALSSSGTSPDPLGESLEVEPTVMLGFGTRRSIG
jgi:hypothetical protein